jgi:hypothetical protein
LFFPGNLVVSVLLITDTTKLLGANNMDTTKLPGVNNTDTTKLPGENNNRHHQTTRREQ